MHAVHESDSGWDRRREAPAQAQQPVLVPTTPRPTPQGLRTVVKLALPASPKVRNMLDSGSQTVRGETTPAVT